MTVFGPSDRISLRDVPLTSSESDRLRAMLAELDAPPAGDSYVETVAQGNRCTAGIKWDAPIGPGRPPRRRRLRSRLGIAAGLVALVALLACGGGSGHDPGRPKCVDDKGRTTTCPEEWTAR